MKFDRFKRFENKSWAYWQFNEYETQINSMYWSGVAGLSFAAHHVRNAFASSDVHSVLHAQGPDAKRVDKDKDKFLAHTEELSTWSRCSFVVAATGSLETYIQRIVLTALISDPAALYGRSKAIDGTTWLKLGIKVDHSKILQSVTSGTWGQRYAALRGLFSAIPKIEDQIGELDRIRSFRNNVGHAFGRSITVDPKLTTRQPERLGTISENTFKSWLKIISKTAQALDSHLIANHVGDFEPVMHLHDYLLGLAMPPTHDLKFVYEYKNILSLEEGHPKGFEYYQGLIDYYLSVK